MPPGEPDERAEGLIEDILQRDEHTAAPSGQAAGLLTFLFADIRGYTRFTQLRGDEAAGKLTAKFAMIVRELVDEYAGTVFELRGDEAFCVFSSPRQSLRFAVAVQQRFVEETLADPGLPMAVGIGVDAGEAVRGDDGYRGGALNLAARLCGQAKAGQVLASSEVTHLARTIDGIRYATLDRVALKGLSEPVRPVRVFPEGEDPAQQMPALLRAVIPPPAGVRWLPGRLATHPRIVVAATAVAAVLAASLVVALVQDGGGGSRGLPAFGENSLGVVDPNTGRLVDQVDLKVTPTAVAAGFGYIWTANIDANSVTQVDAATLQVVDTIDLGDGAAPSAIAKGPDAMWVTESGKGTVARIDPTTPDNPRAIRVGVAPSGVVVARGSVWVTNAADGTVSRIDPARNVEVQRIPVGSGPSGISAGRNIWVANSTSDTVTEIDGQTHLPVGEAIRVGTGPRSVTVVGDGVWVSYNGSAEIARIATTDASVAPPVTVGQHPDHVTAIDGHVWTTLQGGGAIVEIDPATNRMIRTVPIGPIPGGITAADGKLWVTTTSNPRVHRGGTLRLLGELDGIDPEYVATNDQLTLLAASYDGLVAFRRASGADGLTIVPDLATAIPEPTDGGRTYTFRLRSGIEWSTGEPVTVEDVQHGIERAVVGSGSTLAIALQDLLVGARRCGPKRCHISGITVNDANRTVTIRLARSSGNLLDLLTACVAAPVGTPLVEQTTRPIPATGPYQISSYVPNHEAVLTRNPHFHEWSADAQPEGFPSRIVYQIHRAGKSKQAIDEVAAAQADWTDALEDGGTALKAYSLDELQTRFGSRLRVTPTQFMYGVFLNTRIAPFNKPEVRQALAYAIDRQAVADDWFAPATPTCQFLPPDYPGYRPYCPYTAGTGTDIWQSPDLGKALRLLNGVPRTPVTVWANPSTEKAIGHVVDALRDLRYHVRFRVWPNDGFDYFGYVFDSRHRVQAAFMGWIGYDASAENSFAVYRCEGFVPRGGVNDTNPAEFCDHGIDRLMTRAERVQATSLAQANELWAEVERRLVDAAPWVPLVNPSSVDVLSTRVQNFKRTPTLGVLFDQMWVR